MIKLFENKKILNNKGFTLIELLAVIVIMGILMMVAIPAMTTFMENARKDRFISDAGTFIGAVRNHVLNDGFSCGGTASSALSPESNGSAKNYYIPLNAANNEKLMETVPMSPWSNSVGYTGYVNISVSLVNDIPKYTYSILLEENKNNAVRRGLYDGSDIDKVAFVDEVNLDRDSVSSTIAGSLGVPSGTLCD